MTGTCAQYTIYRSPACDFSRPIFLRIWPILTQIACAHVRHLRVNVNTTDMDLMIEAKMKEQTVLRICKKYGITPDNDIAPDTIEVQDTPEELNEEPVEMEGRGRKKHSWSKVT